MSKTVKSQKIYKIDFFGREFPDGPAEEREPWLYLSYDHDSEGNLIQEISFTQAGEREQVASYTYDNKGMLASEKFIQEGDDFSEWREYVRDEQGNVVQEIHHFLDGSCDLVNYSYNESGKLLKKSYTNDDGDLEREETFLYENEKLIEDKVVSFSGDILDIQSYTYHENATISSHEQQTLEEDGTVKFSSFYDESGNKIKTLRYNTKGHLVEISKMFYDENNSLLRVEEETQAKKSVVDYELLENKQFLKQTEKDEEGNVISSVSRRFDEEGRVLESMVFSEASPYQAAQDYSLRYEYEFYTQ